MEAHGLMLSAGLPKACPSSTDALLLVSAVCTSSRLAGSREDCSPHSLMLKPSTALLNMPMPRGGSGQSSVSEESALL